METYYHALERFLVGLNDGVEQVFRSIVGVFTTVQKKQREARSLLLNSEMTLYQRLFDRRFLEDELLTVPNMFSLSRIVFGAVLYAMISYEVPAWIVASVFVVAVLTDRFDGVWARLEGETTLGAMLDPWCDKAFFVLCAFGFQLRIEPLVFWALVGIEFALFAIAACAAWRMAQGKLPLETDFRSNVFGKAKFILECVAIGLLVLGITAFTNELLTSAILFAVLSAFGKLSQVQKLFASNPAHH